MRKDRIETYMVIHNHRIARDVYEMDLAGDNTWFTEPGQFMNITIEGAYLKRPISIACALTDGLRIIYKVIGYGTGQLARKLPGDQVEALIGLGHGFTLEADEKVLVIGGGVGLPPLYGLTQKLAAAHKQVTVILGFNSREDVFYEKAFRDLGTAVIVTTVDGSYGQKGLVTDVLDPDVYYYACGPEPMLKAIAQKSRARGQLSFEARMGCGYGACMGCSRKTVNGYKRICVEGPVLRAEELLWED